MANDNSATPHTGRRPALSGWLKFFRLQSEFIRIAKPAAWPILDLAIRLWLAQAFFVSGFLKLTNWQTALGLAASEYPVSWMNPVTAAYTGVTIELVGSVLLAFGFMTRYAAIPMFVLSLVIQFNYLPFDSQLFWAVLFGWYAIQGAGPLSFDQMLRRGLMDSALPIVPRIIRVSSLVREQFTPFYLALARFWFAAALLAPASMSTTAMKGHWLPIGTTAQMAPVIAATLGTLLLAGFATRYVALVVAFAGVGAMMGALDGDSFFAFALVLFVAHGAGGWSLDAAIARILQRRFKEILGMSVFDADRGLPRVVIVGAGFGGLSCAAALRTARVSITVIDRANHHLFQPLLYQVATAGLSPGDIAVPVRSLFRESPNVRVLLGSVTGVDAERRIVQMGTKEVAYDYLVLATGAAHSYFGKDQWSPYAPGLKRLDDATAIRRKLLTAFEQAEATENADERQALLTFLIVGGGPTGVELAGAIAELARFGMDKEFRHFDPASARVVLVQSAPRLLPTFPEKLGLIAQKSLQNLGVEVSLGSRVEHIDADGVTVSGKRIRSKTVLWAAGVMASPAAKWLQAEADNAGRIKVDAHLSVPGFANVFAIGDTALSNGWNGQPVPGLAPAAKQGGMYIAKLIRAREEDRDSPGPFVYSHLGSLATIGRKSAVADFGFVKLWGAPAWWLWGIVHVGFLVGVRNRMATMINWFWAYLTFGGGIRLITGDSAQPVQEKPSVRSEPMTSLRNAS